MKVKPEAPKKAKIPDTNALIYYILLSKKPQKSKTANENLQTVPGERGVHGKKEPFLPKIIRIVFHDQATARIPAFFTFFPKGEPKKRF